MSWFYACMDCDYTSKSKTSICPQCGGEYVYLEDYDEYDDYDSLGLEKKEDSGDE